MYALPDLNACRSHEQDLKLFCMFLWWMVTHLSFALHILMPCCSCTATLSCCPCTAVAVPACCVTLVPAVSQQHGLVTPGQCWAGESAWTQGPGSSSGSGSSSSSCRHLGRKVTLQESSSRAAAAGRPYLCRQITSLTAMMRW
jgi:hypothetical protein